MARAAPSAIAPAGEVAFEFHGARMALGASDAGLLERIAAVVPPGAREVDPASVDRRLTLVADEVSGFRVLGEDMDFGSPDLDVALGILETLACTQIALDAVGLVFVHSGAVACDGRAIVIPGRSFSGKTSLVVALVAAGATYYSDEYALLDEAGNLHPYARPLAIRDGEGVTRRHSLDDVGAVVGAEPVPVGIVAATSYTPGARWQPRIGTHGEGVMALLEHSIPIRERPAETLPALRAAVDGATVLTGDRGEAAEAATILLERLAMT